MKIKTILIILLLMPFFISAMVPEQESKTLIELMPRELHQELMKYLLEAPGEDNIEKMINAANNIREFIKDKNIGPILEGLARRYPLIDGGIHDQILAAAVLATPNAIKWLNEQQEIVRWYVAQISTDFPRIFPYVIAVDTLREAHDSRGRSILFDLIILEDLDAIKMAIEAGADINARDIHGITPLLVVYAKPDIAQYLIDHGADVINIDLSQLREKDNNRSVEQVIIKARDEQSKKASFYEYEYQR